MSDLLPSVYLWVKAFHIMSVIAWMAGLFYLPRLFVYHAETGHETEHASAMLLTMERKLLSVIMRPAMVSSWILGLILAVTPGVIDWGSFWPYLKLVGIVAMTVFHVWLSKRHKDFRDGQNSVTGRTYRLMNEVPTVLMLVIVLMVVVKPF